jgi:TatD DNase family protein
VLHCFTGDRAEAGALLDLGFYLSFAGPVTFQAADALREVVRWVPRDRVLVETDAPYMAPVPHRGRRNEPRWVEDTAARVVSEQGMSREEGFVALVANTMQAFARLAGRNAN